ncbi:hypothetical protein [Amycolatopsis magusensis]|uniref:hypothetical protein n=1 Tax=Amycolatopsis magusensis TaxID=882444 RepID=UPI00379D4273
MVAFNGLAPWSDDVPKVDFDTPAGLVDLHNCADLVGVQVLIAEQSVEFEFRYAPDHTQIESAGRPVRLRFGSVTGLRISQAEDFDVRAADTLEGVTRHSGSEFVVDLGDIQCTFAAGSVTLVQ